MAVWINEGPWNSQSPLSAYHFVKSALKKNHEISMVFFSSNGVYIAQPNMTIPSDEPNISQLWSSLQSDYQLECVLCSGSAQRRGIVAPTSGFRIDGMGTFFSACHDSHRLIQFGHG